MKPKKTGKENYSAIRNIDFDSNSNASTIISDTTDENFQVSGPTTRRQWSEFVSKPKSESTSAVVSSNEEEEEEKGSVISEATTGSLSQVCLPLCVYVLSFYWLWRLYLTDTKSPLCYHFASVAISLVLY